MSNSSSSSSQHMDDIKYLNEEVIQEFPLGEFTPKVFVTSDNYNETALLKKLKNFDRDDVLLLQQCALYTAIIGTGKKNMGSLRIGEKTEEIKDIYDRLEIKYNNTRQTDLNDDDLTPRRLVRLFRVHTHQFIQKHGRPSYLWLKYTNKDPEYRDYCYPGAEHYVESKEQFDYIFGAYKKIDEILGTTFCDRMMRIGIARGMMNWKEVREQKE